MTILRIVAIIEILTVLRGMTLVHHGDGEHTGLGDHHLRDGDSRLEGHARDGGVIFEIKKSPLIQRHKNCELLEDIPPSPCHIILCSFGEPPSHQR